MEDEALGGQDVPQIIPRRLKGLRACMRCSLIKEYEQFYERGCENCEFLQLEGNGDQVMKCTSAYYEGVVSLIDPSTSWVAKWQRIGRFEPGMYAIEVIGELPDEILNYIENNAADAAAAIAGKN